MPAMLAPRLLRPVLISTHRLPCLAPALQRCSYVTQPHPKDSRITLPKEVEQLKQAKDTLKASQSEAHRDYLLFHPVYTADELKDIEVIRRPKETFGDHVAANLVQLARRGFDIVTGYKHTDPAVMVAKMQKEGKELTLAEMRKQGLVMDDRAWMSRILFLESIAGVPGMVASVLRHLKSLRAMKRDGGWIHTLLSEAENERMHLLSFITVRQPGLFLRLMILGAQGVFWNAFFLSYLISPKACHRFVGYLEEEAVYTYTMCIQEIEAGRLPEWSDMKAPQIAIDYWRLPEDAKMLDMIYAVRADEANHRFTNHSLANLKSSSDHNPFAILEPTVKVHGTLPGFEREEALEWAAKADEAALHAARQSKMSPPDGQANTIKAA